MFILRNYRKIYKEVNDCSDNRALQRISDFYFCYWTAFYTLLLIIILQDNGYFEEIVSVRSAPLKNGHLLPLLLEENDKFHYLKYWLLSQRSSFWWKFLDSISLVEREYHIYKSLLFIESDQKTKNKCKNFIKMTCFDKLNMCLMQNSCTSYYTKK